MTTIYKFKAGYTKAGVATAPSSAPTVKVVDGNDNIVVAALTAVTELANQTGAYTYQYSGVSGLDLIAAFHTSDTTMDKQDLFSIPDTIYYSQSAVTGSTALLAYINDNFPTIKTQLGWSDGLQIATIIAKTLEYYGVATEAEATDLTKLHALADVAVWRQALNDIALDYNFSADGASFSRSQAVDAIRKNYNDAMDKAIVYSASYDMVVHTQDDHPDWTA